MEILIIFFILLSSSLAVEVVAADWGTQKCSHGGPEIRFPFRLIKDQKLRNELNESGFQLLCKNNSTVVPFPSYSNLVVKSISYEQRRLNLLDPDSCVHGVFLNLNLSHTPFRYYYALKNYSYLNCSDRLSPPLKDIPCLSGSDHHVYTVDPSLSVPASCKVVITTAIPFAYSPYLSDNSFGLGLTWDLPECEEGRGECFVRFFHKACFAVLASGLSLIAVVALVSAKIRYSQINLFYDNQKNGFLLDRNRPLLDITMKVDDDEEKSEARDDRC